MVACSVSASAGTNDMLETCTVSRLSLLDVTIQ